MAKNRTILTFYKSLLDPSDFNARIQSVLEVQFGNKQKNEVAFVVDGSLIMVTYRVLSKPVFTLTFLESEGERVLLETLKEIFKYEYKQFSSRVTEHWRMFIEFAIEIGMDRHLVLPYVFGESKMCVSSLMKDGRTARTLTKLTRNQNEENIIVRIEVRSSSGKLELREDNIGAIHFRHETNYEFSRCSGVAVISGDLVYPYTYNSSEHSDFMEKKFIATSEQTFKIEWAKRNLSYYD